MNVGVALGGFVLVAAIAGLLGGPVGLATGAAARYGIPSAWRGKGAWLLAAVAILLLAALCAMAAAESPPRNEWAGLAVILSTAVPGFVAAGFGADRWTLLGMIPAGGALGIVLNFGLRAL